MSLPFSVPFATLANFSRGSTEAARKSQRICPQIKRANPRSILSFVATVKQDGEVFERLRAFIEEDRTLVPVPGSGVTDDRNLWVAYRLCAALSDGGFSNPVETVIKRTAAIRKSSFCRTGERPEASEHRDTMTAHTDLIVPAKVLLVDDVLTRGCTTMGAALCLKAKYPDVDVRIFSVFLTKNFDPEF